MGQRVNKHFVISFGKKKDTFCKLMGAWHKNFS